MPKKPRPTVIICDDLHNLGDLKLLFQNLAVDGPETTVRRWTALPEEIEQQVSDAGGRLVDGRRMIAFAALCRGANLVIGGGQLVRNNVSLRAMGGLLLAALSAKATGGRIVTRDLGVSVITSKPRRYLWRAVLSLCDVVQVRDAKSKTYAEALIGPGRVRQTADMVFLPINGAAALQNAHQTPSQIVIAPCVDAREGRSVEGPMLDALIREARARLSDQPVVIACHDPRAGMDAKAADTIIARNPTLDLKKLAGYSLQGLTDTYQQASLVITNRLHALIFALLTETPVVVIDDSNHKLQALVDNFNLPSVRADETEASAQTLIETALSFDREERAARLTVMQEKARENLVGVAAF